MTRTSSSRKTDFNASASLEALDNNEVELRPGTFEGFTSFRGHKIRYQRAHGPSTSSPSSPTVLLVHGFGGNCDHFRKNIDELAQRGGGNRVYAIDLLGYGYSDKPDPRQAETNAIYNFDTWSDQILEFADAVAPGEKVLICTNSVGGIAGLEASIKRPDKVASVMLMNVSLRMLHEKKQSAFAKPFVAALQKTLRTTDLGPWFFSQIATTKGVGNVLRQCYHDASAVTDELVDYILRPGLEPNAVRVFLDFISYSGYVVFFLSSSSSSLVPRTLVLTRSHSFSLVLTRSLSFSLVPTHTARGPLPEELLEKCSVPVEIVWGRHDPWEKVEWGRELAAYPCVQGPMVELDAGHCPQDEAPALVNPVIAKWISRHA